MKKRLPVFVPGAEVARQLDCDPKTAYKRLDPFPPVAELKQGRQRIWIYEQAVIGKLKGQDAARRRAEVAEQMAELERERQRQKALKACWEKIGGENRRCEEERRRANEVEEERYRKLNERLAAELREVGLEPVEPKL